MENRVLNARRSVPDSRDFLLPHKGFMVARVPKVDLRSICPPVYNQGARGSCTAQGWCFAFEFLQMKMVREHAPIGIDPFQYDGGYDPVSRRFHYYFETVVEGTAGQDNGAQIITGGKVIAKYGVPMEAHWVYDVRDDEFFSHPPQNIVQEAMKHTTKLYYRLQDLSHIKESLISGYPVICGLALYDSFMSGSMSRTGKGTMPTRRERMQGGHCVAIVGFDDTKQELLFRNSWGTEWGMNGYFTLPYAYAMEPNLFFDPITLRDK